MRHSVFLLWFFGVLLSSFLLISCNEKPLVQPTSVYKPQLPTLKMSRKFTGVSDNTVSAENYDLPQTTYQAAVNSGGLVLLVEASKTPTSADFEAVRISLPTAVLTPGIIGTYQLAGAPIQAEYRYGRRTADAGSTYIPYNNSIAESLTGQLVVSQYDSPSRTFSGTYSLTVKGATDPIYRLNGSATTRQIDMLVEGSFTDLRLAR